eukprot:758235-Hanusia_phi.AAC.8
MHLIRGQLDLARIEKDSLQYMTRIPPFGSPLAWPKRLPPKYRGGHNLRRRRAYNVNEGTRTTSRNCLSFQLSCDSRTPASRSNLDQEREIIVYYSDANPLKETGLDLSEHKAS